MRMPWCWARTASAPASQAAPADLCAADFLPAEGSTLPEVIIVGTGEKHVFLHPNMSPPRWRPKGIGLESMSTAAACRTVMATARRRPPCVGVVVAVNTG